MGEGMAFLAKFFPLSYLSNNVRDIFLMGNAFHLINDIVMLVILGAACFVLRLIVGKYSSKLLN
jgi:ABC-type polysaccharide/polyol phosphate export permease